MTDATLWWAVGSGGALGALARAAVYASLARRTKLHHEGILAGLGLARATLLVNLVGSFLLGLSVASLPMEAGDGPMRVFFVTGFCGSLTTFSTLCLDVVELARANLRVRLVGYLLANGLLGVAAFCVGLAAG
jgi:CrcB protein